MKLKSNYLNYLLMAASGASIVLSFAPFQYAWFALPGLFLLYVALEKATAPKEGFWLGWFWSLGLLAVGVFWLRNSLAQFGGLNIVVAILLTFLFSMVLALFYAFFMGWFVKLKIQKPALSWLYFPLLFLLAEVTRGIFLGGFPWLTLGYSQIDTPLAGWVPLGGVYLISLLLAITVVAIFHLRKPLALVIIMVIWAGGFMLQQVQWVESAGKPFVASLVQGNIKQQLKWRASELAPTLSLYHSLSHNLTETDLIIWPETAIPVFSHRVDEGFLQPLHQLLLEKKQDLLLGVPIQQDDKKYYNGMLSLGISGQDQYLKKHLVPFGEFMPLDFLLKPLADYFNIPMSSFSSGSADQQAMELAGYLAGISICYEDVFGEEVAAVLPQAHFLINASNDGWFGDSLAPHQHLQMARMRALETGRYLLRVTNTGISSVINEKGEMLKVGAQFEQLVLTESVQPFKGSTPYVRLINLF